jgi:hypothetical protein
MNKLRSNFDKAVEAYIDELHKQFDWSACYGYWVADDTTGIYVYADEHYLNLSDIVYIVDNKVTIDEFEEWEHYCMWAHEFNQTEPNLKSWHNGCPRAPKDEIEHLNALKKRFEDEVNKLKELY